MVRPIGCGRFCCLKCQPPFPIIYIYDVSHDDESCDTSGDQITCAVIDFTCGQLQSSVDGHAWALAAAGGHGELQGAAARVHAVGDREVQLVARPAPVGDVDHQHVQDVLVGEGGAERKDTPTAQRLGVELTPPQFTCMEIYIQYNVIR